MEALIGGGIQSTLRVDIQFPYYFDRHTYFFTCFVD